MCLEPLGAAELDRVPDEGAGRGSLVDAERGAHAQERVDGEPRRSTTSCRAFDGFRASVSGGFASNAAVCREKRHQKQHQSPGKKRRGPRCPVSQGPSHVALGIRSGADLRVSERSVPSPHDCWVAPSGVKREGESYGATRCRNGRVGSGAIDNLIPNMHTYMDMRTTLILDEALLERAGHLTGIQEKTALVHAGLEALIAREAARRLAALGGSMPALIAAPRRRARPSPRRR